MRFSFSLAYIHYTKQCVSCAIFIHGIMYFGLINIQHSDPLLSSIPPGGPVPFLMSPSSIFVSVFRFPYLLPLISIIELCFYYEITILAFLSSLPIDST